MINAWSLAHDVLNGTIDEEYPIMNNFSSAEEASPKAKPPNSEETANIAVTFLLIIFIQM